MCFPRSYLGSWSEQATLWLSWRCQLRACRGSRCDPPPSTALSGQVWESCRSRWTQLVAPGIGFKLRAQLSWPWRVLCCGGSSRSIGFCYRFGPSAASTGDGVSRSRQLGSDSDFAFCFNTNEEAKLAGGDFLAAAWARVRALEEEKLLPAQPPSPSGGLRPKRMFQCRGGPQSAFGQLMISLSRSWTEWLAWHRCSWMLEWWSLWARFLRGCFPNGKLEWPDFPRKKSLTLTKQQSSMRCGPMLLAIVTACRNCCFEQCLRAKYEDEKYILVNFCCFEHGLCAKYEGRRSQWQRSSSFAMQIQSKATSRG